MSEKDYISVPLKTVDLKTYKFLESDKGDNIRHKVISIDKENKG